MFEPSLRTPSLEIQQRIRRLQSRLRVTGTDGALILQKADLFYFAGNVQSGHLFIPRDGTPILMVHKNLDRAVFESAIETIVPLGNPDSIPDTLKRLKIPIPKKLGLELDVLPANLYLNFKKIFDESLLMDISPEIRALRAVKSSWEIDRIKAAAALSDAVFQNVGEILQEGITEVELAGKVEAFARKMGHQGIVRMRLFGNELFYGHLMSGPAAAVPSYLSSPTGGEGLSPAVAQGPGFRKIKRHEPVLVDYVFALNGYLSDAARIFSIGKLPDTLRDGHRLMITLSAEIKKAAVPPITAGSIYNMAVSFAKRNSVEDLFMGADDRKIRFVGHGVGLELDEYPFLAKGQTQPLEAGMTIALEPKLVFPGQGVVGVENTHVVTPEGLEQLNTFQEDVILL